MTFAAITALLVAACSSGDDDATTATTAASEATSAPVVTTAAPPVTTAAPTTAAATTTPTTEAVVETTEPAAPETTAPETTSPGTTAPGTTETTAVGGVSYPTLPDGTPVPVLGIYNDEFIAISGVVPSEQARTKLEALALANSKNPDAMLTNEVTIDPTVPASIGVRVLELDSVRFPESSAQITSEHAAELDRAIAILTAIPNATVLVIGHSDQRGSEETNFKISDERAQAVANHLVAGGISPLRVSARGVGEVDLLTLADDEAALALNRRTEFVFYGLLLD